MTYLFNITIVICIFSDKIRGSNFFKQRPKGGNFVTKKDISFPESQDLEYVIKQILEIDANARNITDSAMKERIGAEKEVEKKKKELHDTFMERAKSRIEVLKSDEVKIATEALANADALVKSNLFQLNRIAEEKSEGWINEIYNSIIKI